ncbi:MAG: demethoxyubiquinone hydroxylase family protein [Maricaulis sp.]|nr:demethoxyubiquinone hydroxylase family protein [Maricaulis sp.]
MRRRRRPALPGARTPDETVKAMVRVDHAGEYGAVTIYRGQRAVFDRIASKGRIAAQLKRMEADEQHHLDAFDVLIAERDSRPTLLMPVWQVAGHALGVCTALMGEKAAHACTEAVEDVIEQHYAEQIETLTEMGETELAAQFTIFRDEELEHRDTARHEGAREAAGYPVLAASIRAGCRAAIGICKQL